MAMNPFSFVTKIKCAKEGILTPIWKEFIAGRDCFIPFFQFVQNAQESSLAEGKFKLWDNVFFLKHFLLPSPAQSETVITVNQSLRGGKVVELKQTVDQAVKLCPTVKRVFVSKRTEGKVSMSNLDIPLEEVR